MSIASQGKLTQSQRALASGSLHPPGSHLRTATARELYARCASLYSGHPPAPADAAGWDVVAILAEQGPEDRDVARSRVDQGVPHPEAWRWGAESRWVG